VYFWVWDGDEQRFLDGLHLLLLGILFSAHVMDTLISTEEKK
jgi:hypothetical protein